MLSTTLSKRSTGVRRRRAELLLLRCPRELAARSIVRSNSPRTRPSACRSVRASSEPGPGCSRALPGFPRSCRDAVRAASRSARPCAAPRCACDSGRFSCRVLLLGPCAAPARCRAVALARRPDPRGDPASPRARLRDGPSSRPTRRCTCRRRRASRRDRSSSRCRSPRQSRCPAVNPIRPAATATSASSSSSWTTTVDEVGWV